MTSFSIIHELSESKMFPSAATLGRRSEDDIAQSLHLYLVALRIVLIEPETEAWARTYVRRTLRHDDITSWRTDANDLSVLMYAVGQQGRRFDMDVLRSWLRAAVNEHEREDLVRRIFVRMDTDLGVTDASLKAVRRLVMEWPDLSDKERVLAMTRLLQMLRSRCPRAEILPQLMRVSRLNGLELHGACNKETGENCSKTPFLTKIAALAAGGVAGYTMARAMRKT